MSISVEKFGKQKVAEVNGKRMAYIDEGAGSAVTIQPSARHRYKEMAR